MWLYVFESLLGAIQILHHGKEVRGSFDFCDKVRQGVDGLC